MADVSLPPVGELVQITDVSGRTMLACRRGPAETMYSATEGLLMGREDVASWCRVLVIPDDETTRRAVRMKLWADLVELGVDDAQARQHSVVLSHTVLAAVRGAAVPRS